MRNIRTDLALEAHRLSTQDGKEIEGVIVTNRQEGEITISKVEIINDAGSETLGKSIGNYITIECPTIRYSADDSRRVCSQIAQEIRKMTKIDRNTVTLIVGLGNSEITPDALGTEVVSHILITHHLKNHMQEYLKEALGEEISGVCAITPGVLGTTGIETVETIKGIAAHIKPDLIIAVDALAAGEIQRVSNTIQISDAGIQPGSGVGNNRAGMNEETLGTKVISIGVPTVIDARNISDMEIPQELSPLMVTTKDIDLVIKKCAKTIADGINLALHKNITLEEILAFTG